MKDRTKIKNRINQLVKMLNDWNYFYFERNNPQVSDQVYDQHFSELKELEKKYPEFKLSSSPTSSVGFISSSHLKKIYHKKPMLSLSNAFKKEDLIAFEKRLNKFTFGKHAYYCEPKIDGLSISLIFKQNSLIIATTRGDGIAGEDVTANIKTITSLPTFIKTSINKESFFDFEVRGEVFITKQKFLTLNKKLNSKKLEELKVKCNKNKLEIFNLIKKTVSNLVITPNCAMIKESLSNLVIKDNLSSLSEKIEFLDSRVKLKFNLSLFLSKSFLEKGFDNIFQLFKKQKKFILEAKQINKNYLSLEVVCYFNLIIKEFVNPRNAASGSLRQLDATITKERSLDAVFYDLINDKSGEEVKQDQNLLQLQKMHFPTSSYNKLCSNLNEVFAYIDYIFQIKKDFPYEIDGVVIKVNEHKFYKQIGHNAKAPNYSIAFKYPEEVSETQILDIFATVGRTGRITYNARLKKLFLAGSSVKAATLHNAQYIEELDIRPGDYVYVKKAGDIIPKVVGVNQKKRSSQLKKWIRPEKCFYCQSVLIIFANEVDQYCLNENCQEKKIQMLIHFVSRKAMNIIGLNEQNIRLFWKQKLICNFIDIFKLKECYEQILNWKKSNKINHLGHKSLNNLLQAIEQVKKNSLEKLLFGLNIRYVGSKAAQLLAQSFLNMENLSKANEEKLTKIEGVGPILAKSVVAFFSKKENIELIEEFKKHSVNLHFFALNKNLNAFFSGQKVVISGVFSTWTRKELISKLEQQNADVLNSVSKNVNFLLVGQSPGTKLDKAKELNIKIINERELWKLLSE